jgi:hypothetical protein
VRGDVALVAPLCRVVVHPGDLGEVIGCNELVGGPPVGEELVACGRIFAAEAEFVGEDAALAERPHAALQDDGAVVGCPEAVCAAEPSEDHLNARPFGVLEEILGPALVM